MTENVNPFAIAQAQLDKAAAYLVAVDRVAQAVCLRGPV